MVHPREIAAVDNGTTHLCGHTVHVFGGGVCHDVGPPFERTAVDGCGKRVVDDEGHAVAMGNARKLLNVEHSTTGVGDGLAEQQFGVGAECSLDFLLAGVGRHEGTLDAQLLQRHAEEVEGAAVDLVGSHKVVAGLADVEHGIEVGSLTAAGEHASHASFEGGDFLCHGIVGGILQTCIEIALFLQVEELCHFVGVIILESGALDDGHLYGLAILGFVSGLHAKGGHA